MTATNPVLVSRSPLAALDARPRWLFKIETRRPASEILSVVFDFSDSCGTMEDEATKLPRLLSRIPAETPLWFYCLSQASPMDTAPHRLGHLLDGSINVKNWLHDESLRKRMAGRGSLIRPVIEGVTARLSTGTMRRAVMLVLTDGDLHDIDRVPVPENIRVVGLTRQVHRASPRWRTVLPESPLFSISDASIDKEFSCTQFAFHGECEVSLLCDGPNLKASVVQLANQHAEAVDTTSIKWNFAASPLMLVVETDLPEIQLPLMVIRAVRTGSQLEIDLTDARAEGISSSERDASIHAIQSPAAPANNVLADWRIDQPGYSEAYEQFQFCQTLCNSRQAWIREDGTLVAWHQVFAARQPKTVNAMLCIGVVGGKLCERIVIVDLSKDRHPAFSWLSLGLPTDSTDVEDFEISYDRREDRWRLKRHDGVVEELNPDGSQAVSLGPPALSCKYTVLFSGSISIGPAAITRSFVEGIDFPFSKIIDSDVYVAQKEKAGRTAPEDKLILEFLDVLQKQHFKITAKALSEQMNLPLSRLWSLLAAIQRVLNFDGQSILTLCRISDTIELNATLLRDEFGLK